MNKWFIFGGSFAVVFLAMVISGPKVAENLRPLKNDRMQEGFGVYTDKDSGKIYGFIEGAGGEKRFVQMEKNSENKVRKERLEAEAKAAKAAAKKARELAEAAGEYIAPIRPVAVSKSKLDVRSGEIFSKDAEFEGFLVNSRVKWRTRERKMLYRLSITAPSTIYTNDSKEPNCISSDKESELISLVTGKGNEVRLRFKDSDDFWLRDFLIPLSQKKAQNFKTTAIDAFYKDDCGNTNQFVFHGRLDNFSPPDYTWVDDGKLLFSGVQISKPDTNTSD
ncbi:hypothetical protein OA320_02200 [Prochlorococcus sp. AH-716-O10]|nr:hypothetical protein [Prochlorococcus sp. AH-716-O10]